MNGRVIKTAFYAPMKQPDHDTPSGDRRMARLFQTALTKAGCQVRLASEFRSYEGAGDDAIQQDLQAQGEALAARLIAQYRAPTAWRPDAWFTYHLYHKAPDWLGPAVSRALDIPYIVAEASHAPKQAGGPWDRNYRAAAEAIRTADRVYCLTRLDLACVKTLRGSAATAHFPPFLDVAPYLATNLQFVMYRQKLAAAFGLDAGKTWCLTVAMMRERDKLPSYALLAEALKQVEADNWQLLVVGDGPAADRVKDLFGDLADKVRFAGAVPEERLPAIYAAADLYLWPAINEAYGMALLEAQAAVKPVVAGAADGVRDVVDDRVTGLLTPEGDAAAFAAAADRLLTDRKERAAMGQAGLAKIVASHDLTPAAARLRRDLEDLLV